MNAGVSRKWEELTGVTKDWAGQKRREVNQRVVGEKVGPIDHMKGYPLARIHVVLWVNGPKGSVNGHGAGGPCSTTDVPSTTNPTFCSTFGPRSPRSHVGRR